MRKILFAFILVPFYHSMQSHGGWEFEWMELFEIKQTDKEIDRMVYGLYGLTEEEVGVWTLKQVQGDT